MGIPLPLFGSNLFNLELSGFFVYEKDIFAAMPIGCQRVVPYIAEEYSTIILFAYHLWS